MPNKYYYLVSSLPYLRFKGEPPITRSDFLDECNKWLSPEDMRTLLSVDLSADLSSHEESSGDTELLKEWENFDLRLKEELARFRAARRKGEDYKVAEWLKSVVDQETPLLMEETLEKFRWNFIEDKSAEYFFDINWLVLYFLHLQILERLDVFDKDKGREYFHKLCEVKYEQAIG